MRAKIIILTLCLCAPLAADVVVLKSGQKVSGTVRDKKTHYEVRTPDRETFTYLKEEVDHVISDPMELIGDSDTQYEAAKKAYEEYQKATNTLEANRILKTAVDGLNDARHRYAEARELFPEDKYASLDKKLMQIMMLMRILRDRMGSEIARSDAPAPTGSRAAVIDSPSKPAYVPVALNKEMIKVLDPAIRADKAKRDAARTSILSQRANAPSIYDLATAAAVVLKQDDTAWNLTGPSLKALEEYAAKGWLKAPQKLDTKAHLEAAAFLARKVAEIGNKAGVEPLRVLAFGHLGHVARGKDRNATAQQLGLNSVNDIIGSGEGLAIRDMNSWIQSGDLNLAVLAFVKEHRAQDTPGVRLVWSWAILRIVDQKRRDYERAARAFDSIKNASPAVKEHIHAISKSIRAVAPCNECHGEGKKRCTYCHGKGGTTYPCTVCGGDGVKMEDEFGFKLYCVKCKRTGIRAVVRCTKCKTGFIDCRKCKEPQRAPELDEICTARDCRECDGRGTLFRRVILPCPSCLGLGRRLTPMWDRAKVLPGE